MGIGRGEQRDWKLLGGKPEVLQQQQVLGEAAERPRVAFSPGVCRFNYMSVCSYQYDGHFTQSQMWFDVGSFFFIVKVY